MGTLEFIEIALGANDVIIAFAKASKSSTSLANRRKRNLEKTFDLVFNRAKQGRLSIIESR